MRGVDPEVEFVACDTGTVRPLELVLADEVGAIACEAIRNAYTHAQACRISAEFAYSERELMVTVRDDGRGMPPEVAATAIGAWWECTNVPHGSAHAWTSAAIKPGTTASLSVPLSRGK